MCMHVYLHTHMCTMCTMCVPDLHRAQKRTSDPLKLGCVLGTEPGSSSRAARVLNC